MNDRIELAQLLSDTGRTRAEQVEIFALLNLGILESLSHGLISAADALRTFFHAENCLFVRRQVRNRTADEIMSRGVSCRIYLMRCRRPQRSASFSTRSQRCARCASLYWKRNLRPSDCPTLSSPAG